MTNSANPPSTHSAALAETSGAAEVSNARLIRRLLGFCWKWRGGCLGVLARQTVLVAFGLGALSLTGLGIDVIRHAAVATAASPRWPLGVAPPPSWPPLAVVAAIAAGVLALATIQATLRLRTTIAAARLVQAIVVELRSEIYDKLQRLSFRFFDANESGSIINRVASDVQSVRMFVDGVLIELVGVLISLTAYIGYMLSIHAPLTAACLATVPVLWGVAVVFSRTVKPAYRHGRTLSDKLILTLSENVQGVQVVKGFAREPEQIARFQAANRAVRDHKRTIFWKISLFQPVMYTLTKVNVAVLLAYGGYLVIRGELPLGGGLFVFANLLGQFSNQVEQVVNITNSIQQSLTGAQRVFEVLDAREEVTSPRNPVLMPKARGAVRFAEVSFAYRPGCPVLRNVSFAVEPGQCVAIVGATGSGKSTLLSLIPRFYDATTGCVLLDDFDVRRLDLTQLRRNIGLVFQESFLFSNSAAANIAFGDPTASRARIERAARIAAAHEFIAELPQGYDTVIGEYGCNLSGGQRQRLAIARAILPDPAILILDDATASVDAQTEHEILDAMAGAMQGRTTFVVAHRLSTLRRADLVIVLEAGRIVQMGTHEELMRAGGHYLQAATVQLAESLGETPLELADGGAS